MTEPVLIALAVVFGLVLLLFGLRLFFYLFARKVAITPKPNGPETHADAGLEYEALKIQSGSRHLQAWWVKASPAHDAQKAVLIFHGSHARRAGFGLPCACA